MFGFRFKIIMNLININHTLFFLCCCLSVHVSKAQFSQSACNETGADEQHVFTAALCDGNTGLVYAQEITVVTKTEGEDFRDTLAVRGAENSKKYLCRNDCNKEDILIETQGTRAQSGRYIIRYDGGLHVVITELVPSDSGRYRFGTNASRSLSSFRDVEIRVREMCDGGVTFRETKDYSTAEGENVTIQCSLPAAERNRKFLCRGKCKTVVIETTDVVAKSGRYSIAYDKNRFFNVTIAQLTVSDAGRYRCGVGRGMSPNTCQEFQITVTKGYTVPVAVSMTVVMLLIMFILLMYKWKRRSFACANSTRTSPTTNLEFGLYENQTSVSSVEDPNYETLSSSAYETLNQHTTTPDHIYSTLEQQM